MRRTNNFFGDRKILLTQLVFLHVFSGTNWRCLFCLFCRRSTPGVREIVYPRVAFLCSLVYKASYIHSNRKEDDCAIVRRPNARASFIRD